MRICKKCSKQVGGDSRICRSCGAILEDLPLPSTAQGDLEPAPCSAEPMRAEPLDPSGAGVAGTGQPIGPDRQLRPWECPRCGDRVPGSLDACWKCHATRPEDRPEGNELESSQPAADAGPASSDQDKELPARATCPRCGSSQVMSGVTIEDQGESARRPLRVVVYGDPTALLFKDRLHAELEAEICGACGHVELEVADPQRLYRHYLKAAGKLSS